ncbi:hypothetical protein HN51_020965 [Arachis hypogaea]
MTSEDVKSGESAVTKIVTLAEEAKLASREGVVTAAAAPSYAFTTICKSLFTSGVARGVSVSRRNDFDVSLFHLSGNTEAFGFCDTELFIFNIS